VEEVSNKKRVAIACQGGGSHTAFTAGVLKGLLLSGRLQEHEVVALSGTSDGAVCALLAWHHLLDGDAAGAVGAPTPSGATTPPRRHMNRS
jgi:NTE family protein